MWMGKIALLFYVFSVALLFSGYYLDLAFNETLFAEANCSVISQNGTSTITGYGSSYCALDFLANRHNVKSNISIDLIFGDFLAGAQVVFGILTGDVIAGAFALLPNIDEVWMLIIRIIYTLASALLWVYVISGRSL